MWKLEVTSEEIVSPSAPTPPNLRTHKLSWIDRSIRSAHIPFILFYPNPDPDSVSRLKASLSRVLSMFYPFAGEIDANRTSIDCNDHGARLVEAMAISDAHLSQLIHSHLDQNALNSLLPCSNGSCRNQSGNPLLCIQVTTFSFCGGMAIGACLAHPIVDGHSASAFIAAWAAICHNADDEVTHPIFNAASLFAPPPPESAPPLPWPSKSVLAVAKLLVTKRFLFEESTISNLRSSSSISNLTRIEAVIAFLWRRLIRSKHEERRGKPSMAIIAMNVRGKTVPPLPDELFGNIIYKVVVAMTEPREAKAASFEEKVRMGIKKVGEERLKRFQTKEGFLLQQETTSQAWEECLCAGDGDVDFDTFVFTSWTRFSFGEANFGWGKPIWVGIGDGITAKNLTILMARGRGIEAWVTLEEDDMMRFESDEDVIAYTLHV